MRTSMMINFRKKNLNDDTFKEIEEKIHSEKNTDQNLRVFFQKYT